MPPTQNQQPDPATQSPQSGDLMAQMGPAPIQDGSPYFSGGHAVIKFSTGEPGYGPDTFWLVDKQNKTITPFTSPASLQAVFGPAFQQVMSSVVTVMPPNVASDGKVNNGVLAGFYILDPEYAIQEDGTSKPVDFTPGHLSERYGRPVDEDAEQKALTQLDGIMNQLKQEGDQFHFTPNFVDKLMKDQRLMAFYINAIAYGDYEPQDIVLDVLRRFHLQKGGNTPINQG
jgi:hypothetical protein